MNFEYSEKAKFYIQKVKNFISKEIDPVLEDYFKEVASMKEPWYVPEIIEILKEKAKKEGLWNLFLPDEVHGKGLNNVEYAYLAELMGRNYIASEVFNCNAPDTGNMEVLEKYGTEEQKEKWLNPLLDGTIRSVFCMTEPDVASSDATNMEATIKEDGDELVLNGKKWWSTNLGHPNTKIIIFMGLSNPENNKHAQHSMVLVPIDTPGVKIERMLDVFGFLDAPSGHGEVSFTNVRVPKSNVIKELGAGFEIAQGRLGPGRVHHCMRLIGLAELALELMCKRSLNRIAFGKPIANLGGNRQLIADARIAIEQAKLLVLKTAWNLDTYGIMGALSEVSQIKVIVPRIACKIIDDSMQMHGGGGLSSDFPLAGAYSIARSLRLADGPDEVHQGLIAKFELMKYKA